MKKNNRKFIIKHLLVAGFFILTTLYYMFPSVINCNSTVNGFGDNTSGPIWRYQISPNSPFGAYENVTNYPYGENLYTPVNFSASGQTVIYWGLARIAGPVCGYNLFNILGFVSSALMLYGFIYYLTKLRYLAVFAGYAGAFVPYFQLKVGGHPSYAFQGLLVGLIWLFLSFIRSPSKAKAVALGSILAFCMYFDPYFVLFTILIVLACLAGLAVYIWRGQNTRKVLTRYLKFLILSGAVFGLLMSPLAAVYLKNRQSINGYVSGLRGDVRSEARACSNLPHEYVLPFVLHYFYEGLLGGRYVAGVDAMTNRFSCGIGEDTVGINPYLVSVVLLATPIYGWEILNRRKLRLRATYMIKPEEVGLAAGILFLVGFGAFLLALPPYRIHGLETPSSYLLDVTSTWRTLTRLFLLVNISITILSSMILAYIFKLFPRHRKKLLIGFGVLWVLSFVQYQAFQPLKGNTLSSFSYKNDAPEGYYWLSKQGDVKVVAEYPLERYGGESDAMSYYLTMQSVHGKKLINSAKPNSPYEELRSGLKDISDPQVVPVLKALGVDLVVIHGVTAEQVSKVAGLDVDHTILQAPFNILPHTPTVKKDTVVFARIRSDVSPATFVIELSSGFPRNTNLIKSTIDWSYEVQTGAKMKAVRLVEGVANVPNICFEIRTASPGETDKVMIVTEDTTSSIDIDHKYHYVATTGENVVINSLSGHNMQMSNIGCRVVNSEANL